MIAEGPLGPTLLVQDKLSGEKCVIKQVQCTDYTQAQLAYNQVGPCIISSHHNSRNINIMHIHNKTLKLQLLNRHPSNCRYLQFFVHWDREVYTFIRLSIDVILTIQAHAVYVCTVTRYQELGKYTCDYTWVHTA